LDLAVEDLMAAVAVGEVAEAAVLDNGLASRTTPPAAA